MSWKNPENRGFCENPGVKIPRLEKTGIPGIKSRDSKEIPNIGNFQKIPKKCRWLKNLKNPIPVIFGIFPAFQIPIPNRVNFGIFHSEIQIPNPIHGTLGFSDLAQNKKSRSGSPGILGFSIKPKKILIQNPRDFRIFHSGFSGIRDFSI